MNPIIDAWNFLIGSTPDHMKLGTAKWIFVVLFAVLMATTIWVAAYNWRHDPEQRTASGLATWFMRVLMGMMWFQGMLWKLPLFSQDNGLYYWLGQMKERAAFGFHRDIVTNIYIPYFNYFNPAVFLAEFCFAVSLILGLWARLFSFVASFFVLHLWLGIYRPGEPAEWPWSYLFLVIVHVLFAIHGAGRGLGIDAYLRRRAFMQSGGSDATLISRAVS